MVRRKRLWGYWSTKHRACKDWYVGFHSIHSKHGEHIYCKRLLSYSRLGRSGGVYLKCSQQYLSVTAGGESEVCSKRASILPQQTDDTCHRDPASPAEPSHSSDSMPKRIAIQLQLDTHEWSPNVHWQTCLTCMNEDVLVFSKQTYLCASLLQTYLGGSKHADGFIIFLLLCYLHMLSELS